MNQTAVLVILGDRTAAEILEAAELAHHGRFAAIEQVYYDPATFATKLVPEVSCGGRRPVYFHAGVAHETLKREMVAACTEAGWQPMTIVHPTAVISPSAYVGAGVFVGPLAVISTNAVVEDHALVHIHASVGHDAHLGRWTTILPGARISGKVHVGERSLVGSNAFVAAGVHIGADCRIDALSYVRHNLPDAHLLSPRSPQPLRRIDLSQPTSA
jgi:acyl-[acyl carrier protein]--UDP-N-acetylglucosamine O-acyltransferase